ncbi:MAG TPA: hypothetical protein VNZ66_00360 [Aeromicrobium sp.]|nr:hypothetical protein [Aeromicrobium sp.]
MELRRLPTLVAALAAMLLVLVVASRVTADDDPTQRDTTPITIDVPTGLDRSGPSGPATTGQPTPSAADPGPVKPRIRDDDDDDGPDDDDDEHDDD